jgi:hypothetical protein
MKIPQEYVSWCESLVRREVTLGYGGLNIFSPAEVEIGQIDYSQSPGGGSLCDGSPGAWEPGWIVIGCDTLLGDPIILDASNRLLPVMTAAHGEEGWEPQVISTSLKAFAVALETIQHLSVGRENPVELEQNPLGSEEKEQALERIQSANKGEIGIEFWSQIFEAE